MNDGITNQGGAPMTNQTHVAKREALAATVFAQLTDRELDDVARVSDERHLDAGATLCGQSDFGQETFVIAHGHVSVDVDGRQIATAGPGQLVGDWALFGNGRRSATLRAVTPDDVVVIDPREMDSLLAAVPSVAGAIGPHSNNS
jgi:CRP-like cAMP-binding protein